MSYKYDSLLRTWNSGFRLNFVMEDTEKEEKIEIKKEMDIEDIEIKINLIGILIL